ncbi:hypothetical protein [Escherichia coli]|uniref:hypothetical protein n=1 Tax=Escherichia coli TaxID=562 RepID=UPI0020C7812B|nr:hypothetical protein [Escherichia coli]MCP8728681.1 hypothetical protein [Escherichia coli]
MKKKLPGSFSATRHLTAAGCSFWLQKFMKDPVPIKSITVTVSVDNYLSWMDIAVSGLPELPDMPFCDFFIRRQQFIYPGVPPTKSGEE